jgi:hypothetical protein
MVSGVLTELTSRSNAYPVASPSMSTEQPVDPHAIEETKRQIRGLVKEITQLTRQDLEPSVFYGEFLQRVISALAAIGGAVWLVRKGKGLELAYQINLRQTMPEIGDSDEDQLRHARLLHRVASQNEQLLVPPYSGAAGDEEAGNPTAYLLVLSPVHEADRAVAIIEIFQRPTSGPASQRGYLRFLSEMSVLVGDYLRGRKLQQLTDWQSLFTEVDRFSQRVHDSLDPRSAAYTIANEGRRLIGADRVSVAIRRGNRCKIEAVSGQDTMDTRANAVVLLGKLATAVMRSGEPLWFTGGTTEDLPPQIEDALHEYVDDTHTKSVAVIPLRQPKSAVAEEDQDDIKLSSQKGEQGEVIGTLIVEQIEDNRPREAFQTGVDLVSQHSSSALANAMEHHNLFLMPVWKAIGKAGWILRARTLPKTLAVLALIIVVVLGMILWPNNFEMKCDGVLKPKYERDVFFDVDGKVVEVIVDHGDHIEKGQVLMRMQNVELNQEIERITGEIQSSIKAKNAVDQARGKTRDRKERAQLASESDQLRSKLDSLTIQLRLQQQKKQQLVVTSPITGIVTSWDVEDDLKFRPVSRGNRALTVADPTGEWELELFMEEDRAGHMGRAMAESDEPLEVTYVLQTDPGQQLKGKLAKVQDSAQMHEEYGHSVRLVVEIDEMDLVDPRPDTGVTAKVYCGKRSFAYDKFHELIEFLQLKLFF